MSGRNALEEYGDPSNEKKIIDVLKIMFFECLLLCQALCVLGIGYIERNKIDVVLVFVELRVE